MTGTLIVVASNRLELPRQTKRPERHGRTGPCSEGLVRPLMNCTVALISSTCFQKNQGNALASKNISVGQSETWAASSR